MPKDYIFVSLFIIFISCQQSDDELVSNTPIEPIPANKTIIIDSTFIDLVDLPVDEGGEHRAFPLTPDSEAGLGYYIYTPSAYDNSEHKYPLILFLHGAGQTGNSLSFPPGQLERVLTHGPPKLIEADQWNPSYPCIVVSPQSEGEWTPDGVHRFIEFIFDNYRVNTQRIYITGLSMGGRGCWFYEGVKGGESFATALVPICGRGPSGALESLGNVPIWAFHGEDDNVVSAYANNGSAQLVPQINNTNPKFATKLTMYPSVGHNSWERTYDGSGMGTESLDYDPFDQSIYDWLFQFRKE